VARSSCKSYYCSSLCILPKVDTFSAFLFHECYRITHSSSPPLTQILTRLNLEQNQIGQQGAQYIADALKINEVTNLSLSSSSSHTPPLHI
jgi:hypothetical protein